MDNEQGEELEETTISFEEFRSWLNGLVIGKGGALPDLQDWKRIKKMMDMVVPDKTTDEIAMPQYSYPPNAHDVWWNPLLVHPLYSTDPHLGRHKTSDNTKAHATATTTTATNGKGVQWVFSASNQNTIPKGNT